MAQETGSLPPDTMRAHLVAHDVFDLPRWWDAVAELPASVPAEVQLRLLLDLRRMVERSAQWFLRHRRPPLAVAPAVSSFRTGVTAIADALPDVISPGFAAAMTEAIAADTAAGVPAELAARAARWPYLHTAFDVVEVAQARGRTPVDAARVYWGLFDLLDLGWFWDRIGLLPRSDRWQNHARAGLRDDFLNELRALADDALRAGDVFTPVADVRGAVGGGERAGRGPVAHGARRDPRRRRVRPHDAVGRRCGSCATSCGPAVRWFSFRE